LQSGRHGDGGVVERDCLQLEGRPIEVGIERVGDQDFLSRGGGGGLVLEQDLERDDVVGVNPVLGADASQGVFVVRIDTADDGVGHDRENAREGTVAQGVAQ